MYKSAIFSCLAFAVAGILASPVNVNKIQCDGDTYKCTANLDFGDVTTHTPQLAQPVLIERRHPWDFDTYEDIGSYC
ncbi:hypothetical protein G6F56_004145 [Rhizopus delemar]|uniref:Uncharacterized protein n=1 Tax=Rhizopus stolonifer TaxID=4846 RepID=A0A367KTP1_RHIST|nr:hypothetical protein G6F56_004145 [Rhizopus delemar]RCI05568.1 hypothetical protein CU098_013442 [Rhizopus stolonifer]